MMPLLVACALSIIVNKGDVNMLSFKWDLHSAYLCAAVLMLKGETGNAMSIKKLAEKTYTKELAHRQKEWQARDKDSGVKHDGSKKDLDRIWSKYLTLARRR